MTACTLLVIITACVDKWAIGKSIDEIETELSRDMFIIDSLMMNINMTLDSLSNE